MALQISKFQRVLPFFLRSSALLVRGFHEECEPPPKKGIVLGVYGQDDSYKFTEAASTMDKMCGGKLTEFLNDLRQIKLGNVQVVHNMGSEYFAIAMAGLGSDEAGFNKFESIDEAKENVRIAAGVGARALQAGGVDCILVESFNGHTEAAAEGAGLALWKFQDTKSKDDQQPIPTIHPHEDEDKAGWQRGINKAEAQNIARRLSDMPSNLMTPTLFAQAAADYLCPCGIDVKTRDKEYIEDCNMQAFLAVAKGSIEAPVLLEMVYSNGTGSDDRPIVLVGKGITHDLGGLCLKKCHDMMEYRADMSGAAAIVGTMRAVAALNLPLNVTGIVPLCENVPSGMAMKPGDVYKTANGRTIEVQDTDIEGPLILADAIVYAMSHMKPKLVVDVATLTRGMREAMGSGATGAFVTNDKLWAELEKAGACTGDRVWRFPIWEHYSKKITKPRNADMTNVGFGPGGSACKAAAFLREFVPCGDWIHLDTHGTGMLHHPADVPYMKEGRMTGRPTRTLIQFLQQLVDFDD